MSGQGDSTFIVTPRNHTILIDGGGSSSNEFDVGKNTLLPYILDKGYTKIDWMFITHYDNDHVAGLLTVLEEIQVKNVVIPKQTQASENYSKFLEIVKRKKPNVIVAKAGDKIQIEKYISFSILWPIEEQITENVLNNNSLVMKFNYKNFSALFTGDIEKIAEEKIISMYENSNVLKANMLKVAHHGSKTSTTEKFLEKVKPKIALIGVGKDNLFGHPNDEIIERLQEQKVDIYRTDQCGEISFKLNFKGEVIKIKKCINFPEM